jgi:hypothetical protein
MIVTKKPAVLSQLWRRMPPPLYQSINSFIVAAFAKDPAKRCYVSKSGLLSPAWDGSTGWLRVALHSYGSNSGLQPLLPSKRFHPKEPQNCWAVHVLLSI